MRPLTIILISALVLGLLCTLSIAQQHGDRDSHQMTYRGHDWLSPNFGQHFSYYNWHPSYYYNWHPWRYSYNWHPWKYNWHYYPSIYYTGNWYYLSW